jgi:small nuclear ribonucleoprotein (snRNP)-like protein
MLLSVVDIVDTANSFRSSYYVFETLNLLLIVHVSHHDSQLLRGTFVAFDQAMNSVLRDCVDLYHPSAPVHH